MTEGLDSAADLADLTRSAQAVEDRSQEIASKQAETLQQVSDELLSSPEIVRWVEAHPVCVATASGARTAARCSCNQTCTKRIQTLQQVSDELLSSPGIKHNLLQHCNCCCT